MAGVVPSFHDFFVALHGYPPFAWQEEVVAFITQHGRWPRIIAAPTGAGKSSVIDIHVYLNAVATKVPLLIPRRLIMTVNRRNLVDDHAEHAIQIVNTLKGAGEATVLSTIRSMLIARSASNDFFPVHTIRGGQDLVNDWRTTPLAVQLIAATPDMWGSRALFRGYGTARYSRSLEAGILTKDAVLVTDEAHLNRQLVTLARSIEAIDNHFSGAINVPAFQVVETTATPSSQHDYSEVIQVREQDLEASEALRRRLKTYKAVELVNTGTARQSEVQLAEIFVDILVAQRIANETIPAPVGCIVNTVSLALEIASQLRKRLKVEESDHSVIQFVGSQRLFDRERLKFELPDLFTTRPIEEVKFVIATQTIEVGVDVDFVALVSELAPGDALAQRAGRLNRIGHREAATMTIVCPTYRSTNTGVPYSIEELEESSAWLEGLPSGDISPWNLLQNPPPKRRPNRLLWQSLTWNDALYFGRSSVELAAADTAISDHGEDLTLWLRDDFSADSEAGLIVRAFVTGDALFDAGILNETLPLSEEVFPSTLTRNRSIAEKLLISREDLPEPIKALHVVRAHEVHIITQAGEIRPGDILVVPTTSRTFLSGVPVPNGMETGIDVFEKIPTLTSPSHIVRRFLIPPENQVAYDYALKVEGGDFEGELHSEDTNAVSDMLVKELVGPGVFEELASSGQWEARVLVPAGAGQDIFCVVSNIPLLVLTNQQTQARRAVSLKQHQEDVAERVELFTSSLNIGEVERALVLAGLYHDEGKRDERFQRYLRMGRAGSAPLAKSSRTFDWKQYVAHGLQGWRHEQLSAAYWVGMSESHLDSEADLTTWLIGTSHGRGRATFTSDSKALIPLPDQHPSEVVTAAEVLFDEGAWDDLYESLTQHYSPWGLAYLEALVRIADQQVSGEDAQ